MFSGIPITKAALGGLGPWELIIILAIVVLVFGVGKLPKLGSSIGEAIKNFKKSVKDDSKGDPKDTEPRR